MTPTTVLILKVLDRGRSSLEVGRNSLDNQTIVNRQRAIKGSQVRLIGPGAAIQVSQSHQLPNCSANARSTTTTRAG